MFPGIYLTAVVTSLVALAIAVPVLWRRSPAGERRLLLLAGLATLPWQPVAFYAVRLPLDHALVGWLGKTAPLYHWLTTLYAPLTEEPAKLMPLLLLPALRRTLSRENFVRFALAIGVGFGIGELWFIAEQVAKAPTLRGLPWYQFDGFFFERLMVCVMHSAFVSVSLRFFPGRLALGLLGAMVLHYLGNFPLFLMQENLWNLGHATWIIWVALWVQLYFLGSILLLCYFAFGGLKGVKRLFFGGRTLCPGCGAVYEAPAVGVNLWPWRYEPCPACRQWHLVSRRNRLPAVEAPPQLP